MKRVVFVFIFSLINVSFFGTDYSFFKYNNYSSQDYFTGQDYFNLANFYTIKNSSKIKQIKDNYVKQGEKFFYCSLYNVNGQITKWETDFHDGDVRFFEYNEKDYLTRFGHGDFRFNYISENQREYYYKNKLQYRQTIENEKDFYVVIKESMNPKNDSLFIDNVSAYIYDGKRIKNFQSTSYNQVGKVSYIMTFDFEYDSTNNLKKIVAKGINMYKCEQTWDSEALFEYDDDLNLIKIIKNDKKKPEESTVSLFSNYDDFKNWRNFKLYRNNQLCEEIDREIEYR